MKHSILTDYDSRIRDIYQEQGGIIPSPSNTLSITVIEEGNKIIALQSLEHILHGGPLWIHPAYRGKGLYNELNSMFESQLSKVPGTGYYMFPSNDKSKAICSKLGLKKMDWEIWKREF